MKNRSLKRRYSNARLQAAFVKVASPAPQPRGQVTTSWPGHSSTWFSLPNQDDRISINRQMSSDSKGRTGALIASAALGLAGLAAAGIFQARKPKAVPLAPYTSSEWRHVNGKGSDLNAVWPLVLKHIAETVGRTMHGNWPWHHAWHPFSTHLLTMIHTHHQGLADVHVKHDLWPILLGLLPPSQTKEELDSTLDNLTHSYVQLLATCESLENELSLSSSSDSSHELKAFAEVLRVTTTDAVRSDWKKNEHSCFVAPPSGFFTNLSVPDWIETSSFYKKWKKSGKDSSKAISNSLSKAREGDDGEGLDSDAPAEPPCEPLTAHIESTTEDEEDGGVEPEGSQRDFQQVSSAPVEPTDPTLGIEDPGEWCPRATAYQLSHLSHIESPEQRRLVVRLVRVLSAYAKTDPEVGYCQGMSDLAIPFVVLFTTALPLSAPPLTSDESANDLNVSQPSHPNPQPLPSDSDRSVHSGLKGEALAFWCFHALMKKVRQNFLLDDLGVFAVLSDIGTLIEKLDQPLYYKLKALRATDCRFAYRMIVVLFRRELRLDQALTLWEILWADGALRDPNASPSLSPSSSSSALPDLLSCFVAATVISQRRAILDSCRDSDDLLKHFQSSSMRINLPQCLSDAKEFRVRLKTKAEALAAAAETEEAVGDRGDGGDDD